NELGKRRTQQRDIAMDRARLIVTSAAVIALGMCLGACIYESVVQAPHFSARVAESLVNARNFFVVSHGGTFFRVLAPLTQLTLVLTVVLNWRGSERRWGGGVAPALFCRQ